MKQKFSFRYILILLGMCGLLATNVGLCTNVAGLFFTPIAEDFGVLTGSVSMTLTICNLVFAVAGLLAPKVIKETSFRTILIAATVLVAGSTALMSMCNNIVLLYILNAIRGFAGGLTGFVLVTTVINSWFVDFNGLATSIAMSFSGIAGAVFSPIVSGIIQANGWRTGYLFIALVKAARRKKSVCGNFRFRCRQRFRERSAVCDGDCLCDHLLRKHIAASVLPGYFRKLWNGCFGRCGNAVREHDYKHRFQDCSRRND